MAIAVALSMGSLPENRIVKMEIAKMKRLGHGVIG